VVQQLQVTLPLCLLPPGTKVGSVISLATSLEREDSQARQAQLVALQHRLVEVSSGPEKQKQSVLVWNSSANTASK
jgi:hypothetical protein